MVSVEVKYCSSWGYEPKALSLTGKILGTYKQRVRGVTLVPASGGCFEVSLDGELVYSKLKTGVFPDEAAIMTLVAAKAVA